MSLPDDQRPLGYRVFPTGISRRPRPVRMDEGDSSGQYNFWLGTQSHMSCCDASFPKWLEHCIDNWIFFFIYYRTLVGQVTSRNGQRPQTNRERDTAHVAARKAPLQATQWSVLFQATLRHINGRGRLFSTFHTTRWRPGALIFAFNIFWRRLKTLAAQHRQDHPHPNHLKC